MSIKYRVIERGQPGVVGGGTKKFYAAVHVDGEATVDDLVREIEKFSTLSEPDIRAVIYALENVIQHQLASSRIVRLDKLGALYPTISSDGVDLVEDFTSANIRRVSVNYRPGERILVAMRAAGFHKNAA